MVLCSKMEYFPQLISVTVNINVAWADGIVADLMVFCNDEEVVYIAFQD